MSEIRRTVLTTLAEQSSSRGEITTVSALAEALDLSDPSVEHHVERLEECDLATETDHGIRVTVTGEELLALDLDGPVVVDPGK